ncbi:MAG: biopolymer transporter ExbD, partial [Pseudomonadota bacterium]
VELAIRTDGSLFWNGEPVTLEQLAPRFGATVAKAPKTELHIRADKLAHYEHVARIMSIAAKAGMARIGFITDPSAQ